MKIAYWILAVVFVLFALVQYNDPDPVQWMLMYGGPAVFYGMAATGRRYRPAIWLWLGASVAWALTYIPAFWDWVQMGMPSIVETMKADKPYVEYTREFLGLVIVAAGCGWLLRKRSV